MTTCKKCHPITDRYEGGVELCPRHALAEKLALALREYVSQIRVPLWDGDHGGAIEHFEVSESRRRIHELREILKEWDSTS